MNISRTLFGWSSPHIQPLTPCQRSLNHLSRHLRITLTLDQTLENSLAAAVHGAALPVFLIYVGKIINLFALYQHDLHVNRQHQLSLASHHSLADEVARHALYIVYIAVAVFAAGWVEVACWLYTAERQSAVLRSQGVKILLHQDLGYLAHFAGNGEFVSQVSKQAQATPTCY